MPNVIPIHTLSTATAPPASAEVRAVVTLIWPYSSSTRQCAMLLADPDFRLRTRRGQVRVLFSGPAAEAIAQHRVGIGEEVVLGLRGARWSETGSNVRTPGKSVEYDLLFGGSLRINVLRAGEVVEVAVDSPISATYSPKEVISSELRTPVRKVNSFYQDQGESPVDSGHELVHASPAFAKSIRPYAAYDPSQDLDDIDQIARKRLRTSFGGVKTWRVLEEPTPSDIEIRERDALRRDDSLGQLEDEARENTPASSEATKSTQADEVQELTTTLERENDRMGEFARPAQPTVRTMAPPPLPLLRMPSVLELAAPETLPCLSQTDVERPKTPTLQPISSATLPLPSPFPVESQQQPLFPISHDRDFDQLEHSLPPRSSHNICPDPDALADVAFLDFAQDSSSQHVEHQTVDPGSTDTETGLLHGHVAAGVPQPAPEVPLDESEDGERTDLAASEGIDDPLDQSSDLSTDAVDASQEPLPISRSDILPSSQPTQAGFAVGGMKSASTGSSHILFDDKNESFAAQPSESYSLTGAANASHDGSVNPAEEPIEPYPDFGLDGLPITSASASAGSQSTGRRVMAQTFRNLFGYATLSDLQMPASSAAMPPISPWLSDEATSLLFENGSSEEHPQKVPTQASQVDDIMQEPGSPVGGTVARSLSDSAGEDGRPWPEAIAAYNSPQRKNETDSSSSSESILHEQNADDPVAIVADGASSSRNDSEAINQERFGSLPTTKHSESLDGALSEREPTLAPTSPLDPSVVSPVSDAPFPSRTALASGDSLQSAVILPSSQSTTVYEGPVDTLIANQPKDAPADAPDGAGGTVIDSTSNATQRWPSLDAADSELPFLSSTRRSTLMQGNRDSQPLSMLSSSPTTPPGHSKMLESIDQHQTAGSPRRSTVSSYSSGISHMASVHTTVQTANGIESFHEGMLTRAETDSMHNATTDQALPTSVIASDLESLNIPPGSQSQELQQRTISRSGAEDRDDHLKHAAHVPVDPAPPHQANITTGDRDAAGMKAVVADTAFVASEQIENEPPLTYGDVIMITESSNPDSSSDVDELKKVAKDDQRRSQADAALNSTELASQPRTPSVSQPDIGDRGSPHPSLHDATTMRFPPTPSLTQDPSSTTASNFPLEKVELELDAQVDEQSKLPPPVRRSTRTRLSKVPEAIAAWFSPRSSLDMSMQEASLEPNLAAETGGSPKLQGAANGITTSYGYFTPLRRLEQLRNPASQAASVSTIDVLAVVTASTKAVERAKSGPRDYFTIFRVADMSLPEHSNAAVRVEVFRPWRAVLPFAEAGDVVLLRSFAVKSKRRQPLLLSTDASSWCVWRYGERSLSIIDGQKPARTLRRSSRGAAANAVREEVKGPPVEFGEQERQHAHRLHEWWSTNLANDGTVKSLLDDALSNGLNAADISVQAKL